MILVDDQAGSKDLFPYIKTLTPDALMTRIDSGYGDAAWYGNGPNNTQVRVGFEYKTIDDVLDCVSSGRFGGHQAIGMTEHYDRRYLLVEGRIRTDRNTGVLQRYKGDQWRDIEKAGRRFTFTDLEHWFTTVEEQGQFRVIKTFDPYESARYIVAKHSWWTGKLWDEHDALKTFHVAQPPAMLLTRPSFLRRVAKELPDVGWDKSISVEAKFKSVREMINANEQTWRSIDGIGKVIASRIVLAVSGEGVK